MFAPATTESPPPMAPTTHGCLNRQLASLGLRLGRRGEDNRHPQNVKCVPSFTDTLLSVDELWQQSRFDIPYGPNHYRRETSVAQKGPKTTV